MISDHLRQDAFTSGSVRVASETLVHPLAVAALHDFIVSLLPQYTTSEAKFDGCFLNCNWFAIAFRIM